jgi:hypothetical protein
MQAVVDWSYGLLSQDEQRSFRALGIFTGGFTIEAAAYVAMDAATAGADAIDRLAGLVAKSLVVADASGANPRFRLLDTTRAYALEKLSASGDRPPIAQRHGEYYRDLFRRAEGEATARPSGEWLTDYAEEIDNLRAALDWAFSPVGNRSIGVALTDAVFPIWMRLSLLEECSSRAKLSASYSPGIRWRVSHKALIAFTELGAETKQSTPSREPHPPCPKLLLRRLTSQPSNAKKSLPRSMAMVGDAAGRRRTPTSWAPRWPTRASPIL